MLWSIQHFKIKSMTGALGKYLIVFCLVAPVAADGTDAFGPHVKVNADMQGTVDAWFKGQPTNGLVCAVALAPTNWVGSPEFTINVINSTTNFIPGFVRLPTEGSIKIELFDSKGVAVEKSELGKRMIPWTSQQLRDWFADHVERPRQPNYAGTKTAQESRGIVDTLFPLLPRQISDEISLPQWFNIKSGGDYEMRLQKCAAFSRISADGKAELSSFWFPEIVAKVAITKH